MQRARPPRSVKNVPWLRSSPGPETGCSGNILSHVERVAEVAILTRSGDRVQHAASGALHPDVAVAILTRSGDRVQPGCHTGTIRRGCRCDPHPVRRPGAAIVVDYLQLMSTPLRSSPGPETGCSSDAAVGGMSTKRVAILTRSGDRVQHAVAAARAATVASCDPHPVRRPGAANPLHIVLTRPLMLRSSPGPETGCSLVSTISTPVPSAALRSSPGPETGCSAEQVSASTDHKGGCDPHPVRRPGAALAAGDVGRDGGEVAILTRSGDRVQPLPPPAGAATAPVAILHPVRRPGAAFDQPVHEDAADDVAILTRSGDRVQLPVVHLERAPTVGCDPHPVRRPGAACRGGGWLPVGSALRSSPGPETGCSRRRSQRQRTPARCDPHPVRRPGAAPEVPGRDRIRRLVAILTRSGDRVQLGCAPRRSAGGHSCDPHPVRRPGAAGAPGQQPPRHHRVAILTRSGDRVQPDTLGSLCPGPSTLRSSPGPETGCSRLRSSAQR